MCKIQEPSYKQLSREKVYKAEGSCQNQVHSDQIFLKTGRGDAGPGERHSKALKTKLTQGGGGPSGSSSDGSCDGQVGGWTT
jgi:hypothetical protein